VAANLRYHVEQEGGQIQGRTQVTQRLKRHPTLIDKLAREQGNVTQMHDIGGVCAVLPSVGHVYSVSRRLRKSWQLILVRDYIVKPKPLGYRALHLIVRRKGRAIEVQLRTIGQDIWANVVEDASREQGVGFKYGAAGARVQDYFLAMSEVLARFDIGELSPAEVRHGLQTLRS
jgi:ppGpp synthetase/RelA/SpoT-type nucleotidyltranferase